MVGARDRVEGEVKPGGWTEMEGDGVWKEMGCGRKWGVEGDGVWKEGLRPAQAQPSGGDGWSGGRGGGGGSQLVAHTWPHQTSVSPESGCRPLTSTNGPTASAGEMTSQRRNLVARAGRLVPTTMQPSRTIKLPEIRRERSAMSASDSRCWSSAQMKIGRAHV